MLRALREMVADKDDYGEEIVEGRSGVCYVGMRRIAKSTVLNLIRLGLITTDTQTSSKDFTRYTMTECGHKQLGDPSREPELVTLMREKRGLLL